MTYQSWKMCMSMTFSTTSAQSRIFGENVKGLLLLARKNGLIFHILPLVQIVVEWLFVVCCLELKLILVSDLNLHYICEIMHINYILLLVNVGLSRLP